MTIESHCHRIEHREQFKLDLQELLEEDESMATGQPAEVIYSIDDLTIYGGFYSGIRSVDHRSLIFDYMSWENLIEWGVVVIPETNTYISDESVEKYQSLGFTNIPTGDNHIIGRKS